MRGNTRSWLRFSIVALAATWALLPIPVLAHGENDARPIARNAAVGSYEATVWQVIGDHGSDLSAHVVIDFGAISPNADTSVFVVVDSAPELRMAALPADGEAGMWNTAGAVAFGDVVRIGIADGDAQWLSAGFDVPPPPGDSLLAKLAFGFVVFVSTLIVLWMGRRARRVWARSPQPVSVTQT